MIGMYIMLSLLLHGINGHALFGCTAPRYSWICSNSNAVAVQITSWQVATRQISEPFCRASATTSTGNSVSRSLPHFGHATGNLTVGSLIAVALRHTSILRTYVWGNVNDPRRLTQSTVYFSPRRALSPYSDAQQSPRWRHSFNGLPPAGCCRVACRQPRYCYAYRLENPSR